MAHTNKAPLSNSQPIPVDIMRRPYYHMSSYTYSIPNAYPSMPYFPHDAASNPSASYYYYYNYGVDPSQYHRKRQRRQAAAVVVESLWNNNTMGRKSTAQPRPKVTIPPRGIGPIVEPNENDVLCGRGGRINSHPGNIKFRDVINARKKEYLAPTTKKLEKAHIAAAIVYNIRAMDPSGRFLKEDRDTRLWFDIGDAKAIKKTGQALREDAPEIRPDFDGDSSGEEKPDKKLAPKEEKKEDKPKAAAKARASTSPKATNSQSQAQASNGVTGHGPQHVPSNWQQTNGSPGVMPQPDYQGQMAMPPPFSYQVNPYMQQQQQQGQQPAQQFQQPPMQQQNFEDRTIPIQAPLPYTMYSLPNQFVSGTKSVGRRVANASWHAMDALSQNAGHHGDKAQNQVPPDDVAFDRQFYHPVDSVLSSGNTVSSISGISDPISSTIGGSAVMSDHGVGSTKSGISGMSGLSGLDSAMSPRNSIRSGSKRDPTLRFSGMGVSVMGRSSRAQFLETMRSNRISDLTNSARSLGSVGKSLSFEDASMAIMEGEELFSDPSAPETSVLSGEVASVRFSVSSGRVGNRDSSAMSVTSMSTNSSARWLAGLKDNTIVDDGRSVLSEMSADLHALDLAHP